MLRKIALFLIFVIGAIGLLKFFGLTAIFPALISGILITFFGQIVVSTVSPDLKRWASKKWKECIISSRNYDINIASRLDLERTIELEEVKTKLLNVFSKAHQNYEVSELHYDVHELHFNIRRKKYEVFVKIQPDYRLNDTEESQEVLSINVIARLKTRYKELKDRIHDLKVELDDNVERELRNNFECDVKSKTLYVETEKMAGFLETLDNLKTTQIEGEIKDSTSKFAFYDNKIKINNQLDTIAINWLKDTIAYIG